MYTEHSKRQFKDLFEEGQVYRCTDDIHCKHGIFNKDSLIFIETIKLDAYTNREVEKHAKRPTYEYIKIFDYNDYLDVDIKREDITQDIPLGINTVNFNTAFELVEDQTNIVNDAVESYDNKKTIGNVFGKIAHVFTIISTVISFLTILAYFGFHIVVKALLKDRNVGFIEKYVVLAAIISISIVSFTILLKIISCVILKSAKNKYLDQVYIDTYDDEEEDSKSEEESESIEANT